MVLSQDTFDVAQADQVDMVVHLETNDETDDETSCKKGTLSNRYLLQKIPPFVCVSVKPVVSSSVDSRVVEIDDVPHEDKENEEDEEDEDREEKKGNIPLFLVPMAVTLANGVYF
jgi:hypothetical protein